MTDVPTELQPGENRGIYIADGDARDPRNLIDMGEGLVPDRYEYVKVRIDRDPLTRSPAAVVGTVTLDFVDHDSVVDMVEGEEVTINKTVDFRGLYALKTSDRAQVSITGKKPLQR